ncbi:leucine--tRNA ligase [Bradyrhizobium sp. Cp5.3]|uniref:leucine--tRNA ligase n=1 Tax=Bradyrhizobium sp. Cp5.3 TaxID=443598 RepID=UPI000482A207|nr:class I tRNA ligase family protein [Bradyrhizobium sp. Cp5.3]
MNPVYDPASFETKWQQRWLLDKTYSADVHISGKTCFVVDMFPYPSGNSMHVGHPRGYVGTDVYSRMKRMQGYRVLHPMGWDAFGLPAEETAIENKEYPATTVARNVERFKSQLIRLGLAYDWDREINTTEPGFYKHTQRIFLEMFRRGLAYYSLSYVNWCPGLGTVLANEDIVDGKSERGGHPVFQQPMRQWTLRITAYASRLIDDLNLLPQWPEAVKNAQRNWIGRSTGHEFSLATTKGVRVDVFTTRIETLPGVTFAAIAPDSPLVAQLLHFLTNRADVEAYVAATKSHSDRDRTISKEKTGVVLSGISGINPVTGQEFPLVIADYVLASYGSGAVMGVPAHDDRDREIALAFGLPIVECIEGDVVVSSSKYDGLKIDEARREFAKLVDAGDKTNFKMRDWVFSRQRFWGEPFPIVWVLGRDAYEEILKGPAGAWAPTEPITYSERGEVHFAVPVVPGELDQVELPVVESYEPTGEPSGPLATLASWVDAWIEPDTGRLSHLRTSAKSIPCRRETNTMPQWAGSSWYWLRYMDPNNDALPFSAEAAATWGPVNVYAGADHAVAHLIYARFWHKVLYDCGLVPFVEPFERLEFLGYVLASDGTKISKRKGNSRNPDDVIREVGADAFRLYELALGPFEKAVPWIDENLVGARRFLDRLWRFALKCLSAERASSSPEIALHLNNAVQKVTSDAENFKFNTAVAALNILLNECEGKHVNREDLEVILRITAPFAPHMAEELWSHLGRTNSIHHASWPEVDERALIKATIVLPVQINGRRRAEIVVPANADETQVRDAIAAEPNLRQWVQGATIKKVIFVPGRIVNMII